MNTSDIRLNAGEYEDFAQKMSSEICEENSPISNQHSFIPHDMYRVT